MEKHITFKYHEFPGRENLTKDDEDLLDKAFEALENAYSAYSGFSVGAAVLLANGVVVKGNNQENAAYPSGLCAERVAIFSASANYPGVAIKAIAIAAKSQTMLINSPVTPCGACRQVMVEFENHLDSNMRVIMSGASGPVVVTESAHDLMPLVFDGSHLKNQ